MDANARTDSIVKTIFSHLLAALEHNEVDIRKNLSPEPLHQFRVALRRTRTLLGQMKGIFPPLRGAKFKREFAWLGKVTSATRDIDVYLLFLNAQKPHLLPNRRSALAELYQYLHRRRETEYRLMIKALDSARYVTLKKDWKNFLAARNSKHATLTRGREAIIHTASKFIWCVYKKILKKGCKINSDSPPATLHELRKIAKKLRYFIEFFQTLYPRQKTEKMIKNLKRLQNILGRFQDLQVQQRSLGQFILEMEKESPLSSITRHAMEELIGEAAQQGHSVRAAFDDEFTKFASEQNHALYKKTVASER